MVRVPEGMCCTTTSICTFIDNKGEVVRADVEVTQEGTGIHRAFTVERGGVFRLEQLNPRKKVSLSKGHRPILYPSA